MHKRARLGVEDRAEQVVSGCVANVQANRRIDFDQFELIENTYKRGAFSSIYSAIWMEGPRLNLDEEADVWSRNGPTKVILKRLDNSQNMSQEFVNQVSIQAASLDKI